MNGFGIIDEAVNYETGVVASNMRIYDAAAGKWKVTWLKLPDYGTLTAEGVKQGDEITIINVVTQDRYVFSDITDSSYRWTLLIPVNGEYIPVREIECTRK